MLQVLDQAWKEHLAAMDYLRQGIHLRGYAQKNPKQEYKREAFEMFAALTERIKHEVISVLSKIQVRAQEDVQAVEEQRRLSAQLNLIHEAPPVPALADGEGEGEGEGENDDEAPTVVRARPAPRAGLAFTPPQEAEDTRTPYVRDGRKVGRNEPCPCGSGKKFKQCHGKVA
jgi:preprotein translocase subunit SecA